jgi:CIC family chloride channel protein
VRDALEGIHLEKVFVQGGPLVTFVPATRAGELCAASGAQDVYPVLDASGKMVGIVTSEELDSLRAEPDLAMLVNAADVMRAPVSVSTHDDLHAALEAMLGNGIRRLPVLDDEGRVAGFVDEDVIAKAYLRGQTARGD